MDKNLQEQNWYNQLLEEVEATLVEFEFNSRWSLIEGYHKVGELLRDAVADAEMSITELVHRCAVDMEVSERKLWYAVKFFDMFPDLQKLPEGKDVSFSKIRRKYLTEGKDKLPEELPNYGDSAIERAINSHLSELIKSATVGKDGSVVIVIPAEFLTA